MANNDVGVSGEAFWSDKLNKLKQENQTLRKTVNDLANIVSRLDVIVSSLEGLGKQTNSDESAPNLKQKANVDNVTTNDEKKKENDDDLDLFGSDEDEEANETRNKRLEEYAAKKAKKVGVIAKSSVVLDVKPWDDETDMKEVEKQVRSIQMDGLLWGASKLVPLAYGIKKLQIMIVIEDEKVSVEELTEKIEALEDLVQSVDIAAFNKI